MSRYGHTARGGLWRLLALIFALVLVASACGSGNDDDDGSTSAGATEAPSDADDGDTDGDSSGDSDAGGTDDGGTDSDDGSSEPAPAPEEPAVEAPVYGGNLIFGLEAETTNGFNPLTAQAAVSGHLVLRQLYDPLFIEGSDGEILPFLVDTYSSNDDFTEWTITLRSGISFHDGTPVNSAAVVRHFAEMADSTLINIITQDWGLEGVDVVDDLTVTIRLSHPVATLPAGMTGLVGYLPSPSMYDLGPEGSARNPIGTGPFMLDEWIPNDVTRLVRNPNYWRTGPDGEQLPYLDSIEFRPIPDSDARFLALRSGELHASVSNDNKRTEDYDNDFQTFREDGRFAATSYLLFNASREPFSNVEFRRALAQCTDRQTYSDLRWGGATPANGPFSPGTPGYLEDTGFPEFDPEAGRAAIESLGVSSVELGTTNVPDNRISTELLASMWGDCGLDVSITQVDQSEIITNAVFGQFTAFLWRNHTGYDISVERVWWHSNTASGIAINFGRILDDRIDAALDASNETADPDERKVLAEELNRAFADGVYNLWLHHSVWAIPTQENVRAIDQLTLPDGGEHQKIYEGRAFLGETWLAE